MNTEPAGLGERGSRIFCELASSEKDPLIVQVVIEAARAADRLDDLDRAVQGEGVLDLMRATMDDTMGLNPNATDITVNVKLSFAGVLSEARQQQDNFRKLMADVSRLKKGHLSKPDAASQQPAPTQGDTIENELERRRQMRKSQGFAG